MIHRSQIDAQMRALLAGHGCLDAAAETINARWGINVGKGTLSRRLAGDLPWTVLDVIALEDALGRYPVTRAMARRQLTEVPGDVVAAAQTVSKETGEAVAALIGAALGAPSAHHAQTITEIDEAIAALRAARSALAGLEVQNG